jgi:hypothetical protein
LGGLLTIITSIFTVGTTFYFGSDLYFRTNPNIVFNEIIPENYTNYNISKDNFLIFYQFQDGLSSPIDMEDKLFIHSYYMGSVKDDNGFTVSSVPVPITTVKCDKSIVANSTLFDHKKLGSFYCINLTNPDPTQTGLNLGGYFDGDFVNYLYTFVSFCQFYNYTTGGGENCTNTTELQNYFIEGGRESYIALFVQKTFLVEEELNTPLRRDYSNLFQKIGLKQRKKQNLLFQELHLSDDQGIILPTDQEFSSFTIFKDSVDYEEVGNNYQKNFFESSIFEIGIYFIKDQAFYKRTFMKIQDLTAQVGGFVNGVVVIFYFSINFFTEVQIKRILINNMFEHKHEKRKTNPKIRTLLIPDKDVKMNDTVNNNIKTNNCIINNYTRIIS